MKEATRHQESGALCDGRKRSSEQERELNKEARHVQVNKTHARAHVVQTVERETCMKSSQCTSVVGRDKKILRRNLSEVAVFEPAMYEDHLRICHHNNHQQGITCIIESIQHRGERNKP